MEQVPNEKKTYLIIGGGKLALHFTKYFSLLNINFYQWDRRSNLSLEHLLKLTSKVLLAISDDSIDLVASSIKNKLIIHFSGAHSSAYAESAHPLFTFGSSLNSLDEYESISFITEKGRKSFSYLFPELKNNSFKIDPSKKILYHAWASMVGNFSSVLISEYAKVLKKITLPVEIADPYLRQVIKNSLYTTNPLTGPISRGDKITIQKHLKTIDEDFKKVYESFVELIEKRKI
tara:strand:+ start:355 stop:1053 length:699 start_codon:yes stop_codon:yes gene_type:complete